MLCTKATMRMRVALRGCEHVVRYCLVARHLHHRRKPTEVFRCLLQKGENRDVLRSSVLTASVESRASSSPSSNLRMTHDKHHGVFESEHHAKHSTSPKRSGMPFCSPFIAVLVYRSSARIGFSHIHWHLDTNATVWAQNPSLYKH